MAAELEKITPPKDLSDEQNAIVFQHIFHRLADYRNIAELYSMLDFSLSPGEGDRATMIQSEFESEINSWGQSLLEKAWTICYGEDRERCPKLGPLVDTATVDIERLPPKEDMEKILNTILFLDITISNQCSARTRVFLANLGPLDECTITSTLKNPEHVIEEAYRLTEAYKADHANRGRALRLYGVGFGAIAGGILLGVTGGLAAPLVGAGVTTLLGWSGLGGTVLGLLAGGLASSSVVCSALFGAYGATTIAAMVGRHTKEVSDLALLPLGKDENGANSLGVSLCISGWVSSKGDFTCPWEIVAGGGDDTFALQWEMKALQELSDALSKLVKSQAMSYVKGEIIKRSIFAGLMNSLAPVALLQIGQIIDNPWMNARALGIKTGAVLGDLLANRVFGHRPVTLMGYSLGALVIFEALKHLASLSPKKTTHLIQDVFLFGAPVTAEPNRWASIRRVVSGRLVNGYCTDDYVLAVLCRASEATWEVAGLQEVDGKGIENVCCEGVDGHTKWRWKIGSCLQQANAAQNPVPEIESED